MDDGAFWFFNPYVPNQCLLLLLLIGLGQKSVVRRYGFGGGFTALPMV